MKRRWAFVFWSSLACLIGFTLVAAKLGFTTWDLIGIHMIGMVIAAVLAFVAMLRASTVKWPAVFAFIGTIPMSSVALVAFTGGTWMLQIVGVQGGVTFAASLCASLASLVVALLPMPSAEPRALAEARVIEESRSRSENA